MALESASRILSLPMYPELEAETVRRIAGLLREHIATAEIADAVTGVCQF
jgi:dTDP-4-amino-4,6-dideoxygalactose transaminase